ncbi:MAG: hypothetical protein K2K19_04790, partial [Acetatifactor sp.]|nr:hypothetical protein [Acetatifactor sp.]
METDLTSKLPLREHIKNIRSILKVIRELDRTYFLYLELKALLETTASYMGLLLSVYILDQLTTGMNFRRSFLVAAATCVLILVLQFCGGLIHTRLNVRWEIVYRKWDCMTEEKILKMDFSRIDDPKTHKMRERIWQDNNWGAGINTIRWRGEEVLGSLTRLTGALIVGAPVFFY